MKKPAVSSDCAPCAGRSGGLNDGPADGPERDGGARMNVVYILWLRQLKRAARSRSRIIGSFAQPLLFLLAFGFGFGSMFQRAGQGNYIQFLAPGIITMSILFTSIFAGIE